jgi:hypothetical protein
VKISTLRVDRILDALAEQAADRASLDGVGQPGHTRAGTSAVRSLFANPEEVARLQLTQTMKARVAYRIKNLRFAKARVRPT